MYQITWFIEFSRCGLRDLFEESVPFALLWIVGLHYTRVLLSLELGWVLQALKAKLAWMFLLARHGRLHMHSQLSSCILDCLLIFVPLAVLWIHEIPLYKRTFFQLCWLLQASLQFPESTNGLDFLLTWHSRFCLYFQLFPRIFCFSIFFVFWIANITFSHFARVLKLWLFIGPFLSFSSLRWFAENCQHFWPHVIWSRSRLNFCQSRPGQRFSFGTFNRVNFVKPVHEPDKLLFSSTFQ